MKASITIPTDLSEITLSDYQKFLAVSELYPDNHNFLAQKIIEIFCHVKPENVRLIKAVDADSIVRKITKVLEVGNKYTLESYDPGKKDRLLNMPMDAVISSMEFFFLLSNQLLNVMTTYFSDPKNQQVLKEDSMLGGDGMDQFSYLLEKTLTKLKIQLP